MQGVFQLSRWCCFGSAGSLDARNSLINKPAEPAVLERSDEPCQLSVIFTMASANVYRSWQREHLARHPGQPRENAGS